MTSSDTPEKKEHFLKSPWLTLAFGIVAFIAGAFAKDYSDFRTANRAVLSGQFQSMKSNSDELRELLRPYAGVARGAILVDQKNMPDLKKQIGKMYSDAQSAYMKSVVDKAYFEKYASALLNLQSSAVKITGPGDAKPFVEAVARYYEAEAEFAGQIAKKQGSYSVF